MRTTTSAAPSLLLPNTNQSAAAKKKKLVFSFSSLTLSLTHSTQMATPLVAPFPEFPADAPLREGPGAADRGNAADVVAAAASASKSKTTTLVYCLRRPGCILCRATALRLAALAPRLESEFGVSIICVANRWMPAEVDALVKDFWKAPLKIYLDEDKAFFSALGNGKLRKGSLLTFLNPFSKVWAKIKEAKKTVSEHNMVGEGVVLGGLLAVVSNKKSSGKFEIVGGFQETTFGDTPTDEEVLALAKRAVEEAKK